MNDPFKSFLDSAGVVVLDGGLATELARRGADLNDPLWSAKLLIEQPDLIRAVHLDYYRAGADVATTASYQATFEGLAARGFDAQAAANLLRKSVTLACEARNLFWADAANRAGRRRPLVAASIGPYGAMLADGSEYRGHYGLSESALMDFHRRRLAVLAQSGADVLACETLPCSIEARALTRLLQEFPDMPAWISFSCRDGRHVSEGQRIAECAAQLEPFGQVVAVGVNCTAPQHIESLLAELRGATGKPLMVYPNSGEQYDAVTKTWQGCATPLEFAHEAKRWCAAGARLIGGCCRTTPDNVRALREALLQSHPNVS
ncbi:MAG: homocysteine S-methyltransferase [Proteobacteria bacterium]|nr:homocysteine S-methyltransferase [Pseudomonadota bacterium]